MRMLNTDADCCETESTDGCCEGCCPSGCC